MIIKLKDKFFFNEWRDKELNVLKLKDFILLLKDFKIKALNFITKYKDSLFKNLYKKKV